MAYRDLKEPEGWQFSSLRKMLHPAARERGGENMRGVSTQGLGGSGEKEPIVVTVGVAADVVMLVLRWLFAMLARDWRMNGLQGV